MNSAWKPIGVGGFRLYEVLVTFEQFGHKERKIAVGHSPSDAAARVLESYRGRLDFDDIHTRGFALDVLQPVSWWNEDVPEPGDPRFGRWQ
ncbi:MAG: hypothetical protein C0518_04445 [Opitutus sp.]|nr:hypothetical protein [Opitutus sp.]